MIKNNLPFILPSVSQQEVFFVSRNGLIYTHIIAFFERKGLHGFYLLVIPFH